MYTNCGCEALIDRCQACIDEFCNECKRIHCADVCKAGDLLEVCENCKIEEELECVICDLSNKLGCDECTMMQELCSGCPEVKTCEERR